MRGTGRIAASALMATLLVVAPAASAASYGWYARAAAAFVSLANNSWVSSSGPVTASSKNGWGIDLALGNEFGPVWAGQALSGEFALTWKYNALKGLSSGGSSLAAPNGHTRALALMYNLTDDFRPDADVDPYVGIGAGYAKLSFYQWGGPAGLDATRDAFAYQFLAGLKIRLSAAVNLDLGYTWFETTMPSVITQGGQSTETSYRANTVAIGFDWAF